MKVQTIIEDALIVCGITVSLVDIQQVLSIILLVFNVCWILWKFGYRIYTHIKKKQFDQIENDIKESKEEVEQLIEVTKKEDSGKK